MSLLDLWPELIDAILGNIHGKNCLVNASLTCHVLHTHANPLLYANIYMGPNCDQLFQFATNMINNDRLASFVKSFSGPVYPKLTLTKAFRPFKDWLQHLINLKSLRIIFLDDPYGDRYPKGPFHLEFLEMSCRYGIAPIGDLLRGQPALFSLSLTRTPSQYLNRRDSKISPLCCPDMKVLRGSMHAARAFFPDRNIVRFEWNYRQDATRGPAKMDPELSDHFNNLRSLSYRTGRTSGGVHSNYMIPSTSLCSLRFLELPLMRPEDWATVATLPSLRVILVLEPSKAPRSMLDEPDRVFELFSKCPTLQHVDIGGKSHRITRTCSRFLRGVDEPLSIPLCEAEKGRMKFLGDDDEEKDDSPSPAALSISPQTLRELVSPRTVYLLSPTSAFSLS